MNNVQFAGEIVSAEPITTRTNIPMAKVTVLQVVRPKGKDPTEMRIEWVTFGGNADKVLAAGKGRRVCIVGRLEERRWTKRDGSEGSFTQLVADHVEIVMPEAARDPAPPPAPRSSAPPPSRPPPQPTLPGVDDLNLDDVPF